MSRERQRRPADTLIGWMILVARHLTRAHERGRESYRQNARTTHRLPETRPVNKTDLLLVVDDDDENDKTIGLLQSARSQENNYDIHRQTISNYISSQESVSDLERELTSAISDDLLELLGIVIVDMCERSGMDGHDWNCFME